MIDNVKSTASMGIHKTPKKPVDNYNIQLMINSSLTLFVRTDADDMGASGSLGALLIEQATYVLTN
jgi:hypothetical protein